MLSSIISNFLEVFFIVKTLFYSAGSWAYFSSSFIKGLLDCIIVLLSERSIYFLSGLGVKLFKTLEDFPINDWWDSLFILLPCSFRNSELFFKGVVLFLRVDKFELGETLDGCCCFWCSSPILNSFMLQVGCKLASMTSLISSFLF